MLELRSLLRSRSARSALLGMVTLAVCAHSCTRVVPPRAGRALRAAACARVITPVVGENHGDPIYLAGFDNDRKATGVHDDLWARGIVLESGDKKIALVTLDVVGYFHNEIETIRALVDPALGLDSITVSSTHNHEGPDTMGLWGPDQTTSGADLDYLDFVNDQVVACIEEADATLTPAALRVATGSTEASSLEPWPDLVADGKILEVLEIDLTPYGEPVLITEGDPGPILNTLVPVMQLREYRSLRSRVWAVLDWLLGGGWRGDRIPDIRPLGATLATLVNFASHPESLGADNSLITSDFPHSLRETLEAIYGGVAMYVSADLGVLQGPLDVDLEDDDGQLIPRRSFEFAERMGQLLAERAALALERTRRWDAGPEIQVASDGPFLLEVENPFFVALGRLGVFGRRAVLEPDGVPSIETLVQVLRVGDATLVVTPNELDPQIGNLYRERVTRGHVFTVGLGNDEIGYQMPEAKFNPSCFRCFLEVFLGVEEDCPLFDTLDCSTTMQNNVGPGADPVLQARIGALLDEVHP